MSGRQKATASKRTAANTVCYMENALLKAALIGYDETFAGSKWKTENGPRLKRA